MDRIPNRETYVLLPDNTPFIMYLVLAPFAIVFVYGLYLRFRSYGLISLVLNGQGGLFGGLQRLIIYAFIQRRVAEKPQGLPHIAIFYGFVTLLIGTTIVAIDWDLLRPFGIRILEGQRYLIFESVMDLLGAIFVIGLITALVSRLVRLRRSSVGQHHIHKYFVWLIVCLLYMGTTGFLLEGLRLTINPVPWANWSFVGKQVADAIIWLQLTGNNHSIYLLVWWSHTIVAFTLIASLPYTNFFHSVGSSLNAMINSGVPQTELTTPFYLEEIGVRQ